MVVQNILQTYAELLEETIMAGGANVEPMRIKIKEEWSSAKLKPEVYAIGTGANGN